MLRPVCVLEMPNCPLLACEEVLHLQTCGGIAARVRAEASGDLKPSVGDSVVPWAKSWPIPKALLPAALLWKTGVLQQRHGSQPGAQPHPAFLTSALWVVDINGSLETQKKTHREECALTSSAVTIAIIVIPCSHTICQKSWQVFCNGPCVAI